MIHGLRSKIAIGAVGIAAAVSLTACATDNNRDLKGVNNVDPDWIVNIVNMDGQPNIAQLCFNGVGYSTTTRDYSALTLTPSINDFCKTKVHPGDAGAGDNH